MFTVGWYTAWQYSSSAQFGDIGWKVNLEGSRTRLKNGVLLPAFRFDTGAFRPMPPNYSRGLLIVRRITQFVLEPEYGRT